VHDAAATRERDHHRRNDGKKVPKVNLPNHRILIRTVIAGEPSIIKFHSDSSLISSNIQILTRDRRVVHPGHSIVRYCAESRLNFRLGATHADRYRDVERKCFFIHCFHIWLMLLLLLVRVEEVVCGISIEIENVIMSEKEILENHWE
jgi:hypothetical protein